MSVAEQVGRYQAWVTLHPQLVGDIESCLRWLSYLVAGSSRRSILLSELLYSTAGLVTFLHDRILSGSSLEDGQQVAAEHLLQALELVQVFLEVAATRLAGPAGKWAVVTAVVVLKTCLRLSLLLRGSLLLQPPLPPLDRSAPPPTSSAPTTFTLPRSGRTVRRVEGAPATCSRDWRAPAPPAAPLEGGRRVAEVVHVLQPPAHLAAMAVCGAQAWTPLVLALAMDLASQALHSYTPHHGQEAQEMTRRRLHLLHYLLRSPLYDKRSRRIILSLLKFSQQNIPLAGAISRSLLQYLPEYQRVYFYVWNH